MTTRSPSSRTSGIIPARAGFTAALPDGRRADPDHPRSRGVYIIADVGDSTEGGSSPLARGLPAQEHRVGHLPRIIPARAGFTASIRPVGRQRWDHPRSRGVYKDPAHGVNLKSGSSPLARGLRRPGALRRAVRGIIPARAGFTPTDRPGLSAWSGSSPLARGLRAGLEPGVRGDRIIPARAGFTGHPDSRLPPDPDHPRSRGVYDVVAEAVISARGSSPLARGLPVVRALTSPDLGIIPARAGFTSTYR